MDPDDSPRPWWRPTWYEFAPEIVLTVGLGWFLIDEPDAATSAFKSTRAVGLMVAGGFGWIIGRVVLARFVPWRSARTAIVGLAALGALAVVVLPAYDDSTVVEAFPTVPVVDDPPTTTPPPTTSPITAPPSTVPSPAAPADPDPPGTPATAVPLTTAAPATTAATTTTVLPEPVRLRTGPFTGIDHRAEGTVSIYRAPDGRHIVGLESFDIQPGPDYDVYVVPGADQDGTSGGTRLDDLRGNQGTQYYEVPAGVDVAIGEWTVLIWCQTFGVPVANATPV
jgi:hypothetical protein